jgi:hypothetical protein
MPRMALTNERIAVEALIRIMRDPGLLDEIMKQQKEWNDLLNARLDSIRLRPTKKEDDGN